MAEDIAGSSTPRLLIVSTVPVTHSAFLMPFAEHYRSLGWRVDGMAAGLPGAGAASVYDQVWDASWSRNPLDPRNLWRAAPQVRKVVAREGYDIVHVHTPVAGFVTRFALRKLRRTRGVKVIYTAHGFHFAEGLGRVRNALFIALERLGGRWTDRLVVINEDDLKAARTLHITEASRVRLIHGIGVDTEQFAPGTVDPKAVEALRSEFAVPPDAPLFTMVAEFTANKRHGFALDALLEADTPDVALVCVGDGPLRERIEARSRASGLAGRVRFTGYRRDLPGLIAAADAGLLVSEREGLPRSLLEVMACGTPAVGTRTRGIVDAIGDTGWIVDRQDPRELAQLVRKLPEMRDDVLERGRAARLRACEFSLDVVLRAYEELYSEALSQRV